MTQLDISQIPSVAKAIQQQQQSKADQNQQQLQGEPMVFIPDWSSLSSTQITPNAQTTQLNAQSTRLDQVSEQQDPIEQLNAQIAKLQTLKRIELLKQQRGTQ